MKTMSETYYDCPACGKENWYDDLETLPAHDVCAYCGAALTTLILTNDEFDNIVDFLQRRPKKVAENENDE